MTLNDYKCDICGNITESAAITQPDCCGKLMRKLWNHRIGISFKGSGFYVNDYKKDSANNEVTNK